MQTLCSSCSVEMTDENAWRNLTGPRVGCFISYCKDCSRRASKDRRARHPGMAAAESKKRRDEYRARIDSLKSERPCYDCGEMKAPEAMDFDHVWGEKSFSLSQGWNSTWDSVREEIDKCQLVCACCHRIRTKNRQSIV